VVAGLEAEEVGRREEARGEGREEEEEEEEEDDDDEWTSTQGKDFFMRARRS